MAEKIDEPTFDLLFAVRRSVRYHNYRRRFFELCNTAMITVTLVLGSAASTVSQAGAFDDSRWVIGVLAGIASLFAALNLAMGTSRRANLHSDLARQFVQLEQRFAHGRSLADGELTEARRERLRIEASEPPVLRLLDAMCHFEILRSVGDQERHPRIPLWRRWAAHFATQTTFALRLGETA